MAGNGNGKIPRATGRQVDGIFHLADGVIVGSAVIKKIQQNLRKPDLVKRVGRFVKYLTNVK